MSLSDLIRKGSLRSFATATPATVATLEALEAQSGATVAEVATVAVANAPDTPAGAPPVAVADPPTSEAANDVDPDRWCWPHGDAMNGAETDLFRLRVVLLTDRGLSQALAEALAEALADALVVRHREGDDRRCCLECAHLLGRSCSAWRVAGIGGPAVAGNLMHRLQRCAGFTPAGTAP